MQKIFLVWFFITALLASLSFVSAEGDIAYIYKSKTMIDQNVINVFNELGFEVTKIKESSLPIDLPQYDIIFIGDELLRKWAHIPVGDVPLILMSYYNAHHFGLTDADGASKLTSNAQLYVAENGDRIKAYTQTYKNGRKLPIPYYYLDKDSKAHSLQQIVGTKTTSSGRKFGDVISYASPGDVLMNGNTINEEICFFGIVKSNYWTPEARQLFMDCVNFADSTAPQDDAEEPSQNETEPPQDGTTPACFYDSDCSTDTESAPFCQGGTAGGENVYKTVTDYHCENAGLSNAECVSTADLVLVERRSFGCGEAMCLPEEEEEPSQNETEPPQDGTTPACFYDSDCSTDTESAPFCQGGTAGGENVYKTVTDYHCENAGLSNAECVSTADLVLVEQCSFGCGEAMCLPEEEEEPPQNETEPPQEQLIHDVSLVSFSGAVNNIRIELTDGTDVLGDELMCNEKYKFSITAKNNGNFTENVTFDGSIGSVELDHNPIDNQDPGDSNLRTRTVNITLEGGYYNVTVNAMIDAVDANPSDNVAMRQIYVSCPVSVAGILIGGVISP